MKQIAHQASPAPMASRSIPVLARKGAAPHSPALLLSSSRCRRRVYPPWPRAPFSSSSSPPHCGFLAVPGLGLGLSCSKLTRLHLARSLKNAGFLSRIRVVHISALAKGQISKSRSKLQAQSNEHLDWWKEKMELLNKPVSKELTKRLDYSNLLGLDEELKNGRCKEGSLNYELLEVKSKFPREVLLCRVGEFYEAVGFDACILVEYAALNPMSGARSESVPRAGCPVMNLRQTLDSLTSSGFSVCVYEEVKAPSQMRQRKDRFISGHAHPGSPYVYGLAEANIDLDIVEEVFVVGISRSARGYCLISISEMMRTVLVEDGLTEEAVVTKLRAKACIHLFLHRSLQEDCSGMVRWGEYGEGGLLWAECKGKSCEWFSHEPVKELISKVKHLYDLDPKEEFREVNIPSVGRPRPLHLGTASQIGILPLGGVPSLLRVLLPKDSLHLCHVYFRNLLLNPPPPEIATSIQAACKLMGRLTVAIPEFTCVSAAKLVKLINSKEANHLEFTRIRSLAEDVIHMSKDSQLSLILTHLLDPTYLATGLKFERQHLIKDCIFIKEQLDNVLADEDDPEQKLSSHPCIPDDFFQVMESSWKGRVKREIAENCYDGVQDAAEELNAAVANDFLPILMYVRATDGTVAGTPKAEIIFSRECESVFLKLRNFSGGAMVADKEKLFKSLIPAIDGKGKRVRDDLYTTETVELAMERYKGSVLAASCKVYELLRSLSENLKGHLNSIVFISVFAVIAKTLFAHVSEAIRRSWTIPELVDSSPISSLEKFDSGTDDGKAGLVLDDLIPYWIDRTHSVAVPNSVTMNSLHLLTGPNGGGKSSILRSIGAAALLGICGLMVPAASAVIPWLDAVMVRMMPLDSPADGKSSFQMEMSELRTILLEVTDRSLILIDELCGGTEVQKGTAITASVIEYLDSVECLGVLATHLHGLLDMELNVKKLVHKAMGTHTVNGVLTPTWKMVDGCCRESLAFETARNEGIPHGILERAQQLYMLYHSYDKVPNKSELTVDADASEFSGKGNKLEASTDPRSGEILDAKLPERETSKFHFARSDRDYEAQDEIVPGIEDHATQIFLGKCRMKTMEQRWLTSEEELIFTKIGSRENPPPAATNRSCVYLMFRPDEKFYVGQTDDIAGRIKAHRKAQGLRKAPFLYVYVPNKSIATELETFLINELPRSGVQLVNKGDQNHRHFGTASSSPLYSEAPF